MAEPATPQRLNSPAGLAAGEGLRAAHWVSIDHTFETAHRLPHLGGKCASLHGHSWRVAVGVAAPRLDGDLTVVEFGALKTAVRDWIDTRLDHGTMLGTEDPLVEPLLAADCRVFRFGAGHSAVDGEELAADLAWPTVEAVAVLLRRMSQKILAELPHAPEARVGRVAVREAPLNTAECGPEGIL
ncbi:6-pyruvoyl trahydropterin synthase family protein [Streptoalloteichus hindustanus]|uniref:6-carboxy-5,6,7,8-tetrahydropterin synthase n=1 Tax=Streptoalloteichus hindustanus TaxID=2017 RepID=A0A1M4ZB51_STRHI|nr:6-carboxytetrahydropterin synthase [Streptoalloteichus hindustanus]SHF15037.1 6-pyruvoyltetrahydropterin/6-carboxytetrahydropterin synthase [Streptoalloteichus hindustanus]